jgi:hypothetical protein
MRRPCDHFRAMDDAAHRTPGDATVARDAEINEAGRRDMLRRDGERDLGENLEQRAALIRDSFELRDAFADAQR